MPRILVLEDSLLSRRMINRILISAGYEVLEVSDGKAGLAIIGTQAIDCILLDLLMPEMSGQEVLAALKEQGLRIPVIVISADIQDSTRQRCLDLGAVAILPKPVNPEELLHTLKLAITP